MTSPISKPDIDLAPDLRMSRLWLLTGLCSLLLGGLLSLTLILGRAPIVSQWGIDPLFAKRCLVVHVNLTLTVWFVSLLMALFLLIPGRSRSRRHWLFSQLGILLFVVSAFFPNATPILSNYVPALDHPLFLIGFSIFLAGALLTFLEPRLWRRAAAHPESQGHSLSPLSQLSTQLAVALYILGFASLAITSMRIEHGSSESFYEVLFWGPGHIFQLSHCAALVATWTLLLQDGLTPPPQNRFLKNFFLLFLISAIASLLLIVLGPESHLHRPGFTLIMRWGTWPPLLLFLLLVVRSRFSLFKKNFRSYGFGASLLLILVGIILGTFIDHSTTLIPAHYHATIGSLTVAYMSVVYLLFPVWHPPKPLSLKLINYQLIAYGLGQTIFSLGFGFAGLHGLGRKIYGSEQVIKTAQTQLGLGVMGLGGTLALFSGATFLILTLPPLFRAWRKTS